MREDWENAEFYQLGLEEADEFAVAYDLEAKWLELQMPMEFRFFRTSWAKRFTWGMKPWTVMSEAGWLQWCDNCLPALNRAAWTARFNLLYPEGFFEPFPPLFAPDGKFFFMIQFAGSSDPEATSPTPEDIFEATQLGYLKIALEMWTYGMAVEHKISHGRRVTR